MIESGFKTNFSFASKGKREELFFCLPRSIKSHQGVCRQVLLPVAGVHSWKSQGVQPQPSGLCVVSCRV